MLFKKTYIDDGRIPGLGMLLREWVSVCSDYIEQMDCEDCPWQYNEVAMTGFLAAAAWRRRGVALQEYRTNKGKLLEDRWTGRCDLYTFIKPNEFIFESKFYRANIGVSSGTSFQHITARLRESHNDAKQHLGFKGRRLGICFVAPFFSQKRAESAQKSLPAWCERIERIKHSAIAWTFPDEARNLRGKWNHIFPGIIALVR